MEWIQDGAWCSYTDPGPGGGRLSHRPYGSELKVRVDLGGTSFYAQTRLWSEDRVCITWHDEGYSYRTAWVDPAVVQMVDQSEYRSGEAARFQRVARRLGGR